MFCPRCGTENLETNKYCRNCRENLQLVAHAMSNRLPVLLFTKIDAALDRKSERFRRDSALWLLFSVGFFLSAVFGYPSIGEGHHQVMGFWLSVVGCGYGLIASIWSYMAFRHSLLLGREILLPNNDSGSAAHNRAINSCQPDTSAVETLRLPVYDATEQTTRKLPDTTGDAGAYTKLNYSYCSSCGAESSFINKFCRSCGANLQLLRKITRSSRFYTWLNSVLDRYVRARSSHEMSRAGAGLFIFAILYLAFTVSKIAGTGIDWTLWRDATFVFIFLVIGAWDYLHYQRLRKNDAEAQQAKSTSTLDTTSHSVPDQMKAALTTDRLPSLNPPPVDEPLSDTENTTRQLIDRDAS
jgi:uncharacterized OB-fold protein